MFYVFNHPVTTGNVEATPAKIPMKLTEGVIHQVDVLFQDGCDHEVHVKIFQGAHQLWPTNRDKAMKGNATVVSFREFHKLIGDNTELRALVWGDGTVTGVEVIIQIGVLPQGVIQPLSFEELLRAAAGTV